MCRDARRRYIYSTIQDLCQSQVWRLRRSLEVGKAAKTGRIYLDLNALISHFTTPPVTLDSVNKSANPSILLNLAIPDLPPFMVKSVSANYIKNYVHSISTKAIGSDYLSLDMLLSYCKTFILLCVFLH